MSIKFLQSVFRWLLPAIAGVALGELILYLRHRRGNPVIVYRASEHSGLNLAEVRSKKLLKVNKRLDDGLVLNVLRIINDGREPVDDLKLTVKVFASKGPLQFWIPELADPLEEMTCQKSKDSFRLARRFIKPLARKERMITLRIFSNTNLTFSTLGGGRNWHAKFEDRSLPEGHARRIWLAVLVLMILSFAVLAISSSPHFRGNAFLQSFAVLATTFELVIAFVLTAMLLRSQKPR